MVTRAPFLKTRFGAYHHREVPAEDAELTHVGPGTPCGEYMRRFWQPICFSDDLRDLPHRIKILGEELVAFCADALARFKVPRYVRFVSEFPMTASGKIQKYKLREDHQKILAS